MLATGDYYVCFCDGKMFEASKKSNDFVILTNLKSGVYAEHFYKAVLPLLHAAGIINKLFCKNFLSFVHHFLILFLFVCYKQAYKPVSHE